ncbi:MAG: T9SS C-terminal target domain-containing protein, partial [Alphaproteobacteria bacterium]
EPESSSAKITITFISGTNVYLDPLNTNDPDEDGSLLHPFDSWEDITWVEGNNYLQKCGTTIRADYIVIGANYTSIGSYGNGAKPVIESQTTGFVIRGFEKSNISINNLSIKGIQSSSLIYFLGNSCDNIIIENCIFESSLNAIQIMDGLNFTIRYNTISVENDAINTAARSNDIYYNIFKRNSVAVRVMGNASNANIYNNVFYDNSEAVSATYAELTLYNNIFYLADQSQFAIRHHTDKIISDHNIFYPEKEGFIEINSNKYDNLEQLMQQLRIDLHSFNSDPGFIDIYSDNFDIGYRSPAINSGISVNLNKDHFGRSVPSWGLPDIGASEYSGIVPPSFAKEKESSMILFPNPTSDHVNIVIQVPYSLISEKSEVRIMDLHGKDLLTKIITADYSTIQEQLDLSNMSNGIYLVVFQIADIIVSEKLIIIR